jgi:hypothetical protein
MKIKPVNFNIDSVTIQDIEDHKKITDIELNRDLDNLLLFDPSTNKISFAGNPFLYHFQMKNLMKCHREDGKSIYDLSVEEFNNLIDQAKKKNRGGRTAAGNVYECFRINKGSVVMFKSTTAKYLYKKYNATSVLDPTAGWGGRMLGAWSLGINYTGIDTNIEMIPAYNDMIQFLNNKNTLVKSNINMIWKSCLDVDFSKLDYDFVLTSPPYINLEVYQHMPLWTSVEEFYKQFLIPLFDKCISNIKNNGYVCFNISPKMYKDALKFGIPKCLDEENLLQQLGQKMTKKQDKIYVWKA